MSLSKDKKIKNYYFYIYNREFSFCYKQSKKNKIKAPFL